MGFNQTIKLLHSKKNPINKMKRHLTEWEMIFENDISDKGLTLKIHKELIQFNIKKIKQINLKNGPRT